jgi:hypothetical protein
MLSSTTFVVTTALPKTIEFQFWIRLLVETISVFVRRVRENEKLFFFVTFAADVAVVAAACLHTTSIKGYRFNVI